MIKIPPKTAGVKYKSSLTGFFPVKNPVPKHPAHPRNLRVVYSHRLPFLTRMFMGLEHRKTVSRLCESLERHGMKLPETSNNILIGRRSFALGRIDKGKFFPVTVFKDIPDSGTVFSNADTFLRTSGKPASNMSPAVVMRTSNG